MTAPLIEISLAGRALPAQDLVRFELHLDAGRPAALAAAFRSGARAPAPAARGGEEVAAWIRGARRFLGRVTAPEVVLEAGIGSSAGFAAEEAWGCRARALPGEEEYREVTDAEAAARIADRLGLGARIEPTARVHRSLWRRGGPIEFLEERARASGSAFAVAGGRLQFARAISGGTARPLAPGARLLSMRVSGEAGRRVVGFSFLGPPDFRPLDRLWIPARGAAPAGFFRVARARMSLGVLGPLTRALCVEDDRDLARAGEARRELEEAP